MYKSLIVAALIAVPAAATAQSNLVDLPFVYSTTAGTCGVTNLDGFERFIATKPTANQFRAAYSCIALIMPGDITTKELRYDKSRYFAELDEHNRIVGGRFQ